MAAPSISSRGSDALDSLTRRTRPKVSIDLVGQREGLVNSYTTSDHIEGTATITVDHETRFDDIEITFEGTSRTSVERATTVPGRTGAYHTFIKLRQPMEETVYPTPRVLESGRRYKFPFTFVVPERMLPQSCNHETSHAQIQQAHTQIPPTLGDPMLASNGKSLLDDMAPNMCQVGYVIRVNVSQRPSVEGRSTKTLVAVAKKVRIIPAIEEEPPVNVADDVGNYCTRKEKDVKRGLMRGKLGRLVLAASQPKPIQLLAPECDANNSVSTVATVHLRFDPIGDEKPPQLGTMWSKLKTSTFYSATPWTDYPSASCAMVFAHMGRGLYTETVPLSSLCVASAQWVKHSTAAGPIRRDSMHSMQSTSSAESLTGPSASFAGNTCYTASVIVPITLPKGKAFVPTFHSCLVSRTYTLELCLSYHTPNANILTPSASLRIPIQIASLRKDTKPVTLSLQSISPEEVEAEFFRPRNIAPPSPEYLGRAVLPSARGSLDYSLSFPPDEQTELSAPPGYADSISPRQPARQTAAATSESETIATHDRSVRAACG